MALEADQRLCLRGELFVVQQFGCIAFVTGVTHGALGFFYFGDGQASGAVACFTVYQRQTGFDGYLLAMDTVPEEVGDLVMLVAFGNAIVCTDIFGIQAADDHFFIFGHRQQRSGLVNADASAGK
jgi:hypothetical protein